MDTIINVVDMTLDNLGAELGRSIPADKVSGLMSHAAVAERVLRIGLSNILKDSHAGIVRKDFKTDAECLLAKKAKIESTLAALMAGEVRVARESKPTVPVAVNVARKLMMALLKPAAKKKLADMEADARNAKLDELAAIHIKPEVVEKEIARLEAEAKAKAALMASLPDIDIDL